MVVLREGAGAVAAPARMHDSACVGGKRKREIEIT